MQLRLLVLFGAVLGLTACGGKSSSRFDPNSPLLNPNTRPSPEVTASMSDRVAAAKSGVLYCGRAEGCSSSVVMVTGVTGTGLTQCTGVLISENEVLTNDHCIAHTVAVKNGTSCEEQVFVHFAKNTSTLGSSNRKSATDTLSCAEITFRSHTSGTDSKDYAIIKLKDKAVGHTPAITSKRGFEFHETASLVKVANIPGTYNGVQTKQECIATYQTMLFPEISDSRSPLMSFGNCKVEHGVSGAPLFNSDGEVGAINQGYLDFNNHSEFSAEMSEFELDALKIGVAVGSQTSCMEQLSPLTAQKCHDVEPARSNSPRNYMARFSAVSAARMNFPTSIAGTNQHWEKLSPGSRYLVNFAQVPGCIFRSDLEIRMARNMPYSFNVLNFKAGINRNYEAEWRSVSSSTGTTIEFKVQSINNGDARLFNERVGSLGISICSGMTN